MAGPKSEQLVIRVPTDLLDAIKEHQRAMQAERPYDVVTLAGAARDLLVSGLAAKRRRKRG